MIRDKHVDVMLAFGILFVVMGHNYQMPWFYFPAYTFHMGFFFFISGYLFKIKETIKDKASYIKKKTISQLIPYFIFNAIFLLVAIFFKSKGLNFTSINDFRTFFVEPFISGHQNSFIIPLWFLLNLYVLTIVAQLIYWKDSILYKLLITIPIVVIAFYALEKGLVRSYDYKLLLIRTSYALLFFQLGILIKTFKNKVDKLLFKPIFVFFLWVSVSLLTNLSGNISYSIVWGDIGNSKLYVPILSTTFIIFISYSICHYISKFISNTSYLLHIGQNSFWIMALHIPIFFIVNIVFYSLGYIEFDNLKDIYFHYKVDQYFYYYLFPALVFPVFFASAFHKLKKLIVSYPKKK